MGKGLVMTYVLWAAGGLLGLHHLYLGRDSHALLWLLTFGGFGVGWAREFYRIPAYVEAANREEDGGARSGRNHRAMPPPMSPFRLAGQVCVGVYFGVVALIGLRSLSCFWLLVLPLSVCAGVHLVSCAGPLTSDLHSTLFAGLLASPVFYGNALAPLPISLAASITASQHRHYKPTAPPGAPPDKLGARLYRLGLCWLAFSAPLGYCAFYNTTATLSYISDCVAALLDWLWFFPWLGRLLESCLLLPYRVLCLVTGGRTPEQGWEGLLDWLIREYSERERHALKVLSLSSSATPEEITHSYRELVKQWHPDHNPGRSQEAAQMFLQIQEAYETLQSRRRAHRAA
ncbi:dnaJ homolog subfamily C member 22 [Amia ocellicauda]|uniref:dnaJ homolog subfamily C member 22 n=1 Tax=Amia ocellicauda TaxID=2972642 RepID=UPI0034639A21